MNKSCLVKKSYQNIDEVSRQGPSASHAFRGQGSKSKSQYRISLGTDSGEDRIWLPGSDKRQTKRQPQHYEGKQLLPRRIKSMAR